MVAAEFDQPCGSGQRRDDPLSPGTDGQCAHLGVELYGLHLCTLFVQDRDRVSGHLHVHTDRGPVTVGTTNYIRKA